MMRDQSGAMKRKLSYNASDSESYTRSDLGIDIAVDVKGQKSLVIDLDGGPAGAVNQCRAHFDPSTKRWRLSAPADQAGISLPKPTMFPPASNHEPKLHLPHMTTPTPSWTDALPKTEYVEYFKSVDWAATPLGPLESWESSLQLMVNLLLVDSTAACLYWGPHRLGIYNELMTELSVGRLKKSRKLLGVPFNDTWPELVSDFDPMFDSISKNRVSVPITDVNLFPEMDGACEEMFFSGTYLPIVGQGGEMLAIYNRARETTKEAIRERRTQTLNSIAAPPGVLSQSVWRYVFHALESNDRDFPVAFAYSIDEDPSMAKCTLRLERSIGVPANHPSVPASLELYEGKGNFVPFYRKAKAANQVIFLRRSDGTLQDAMIDGFQWKGFGEPSSTLAVLPIATTIERSLGFVVVGLNSRRPLDAEYESFMHNLAHQMSLTICTAIDLEEAREREDRLREQLADNDRQIRYMAEYAPVGMSRITTTGVVIWGNEHMFAISGHSSNKSEMFELSFMDIVLQEDLPLAIELWTKLVQGQNATASLRVRRKWSPPKAPESSETPEEEHAWILCSCYPIKENGEVKSIAAYATDISALKWSESLQEKSAAAAKEAKRLIEKHVDLTSHEIRNPLSAIMQSAEGISTALEDLESAGGHENDEAVMGILFNHVDAAKTILLCASHQKRIIDDVLTLSRLESMMLSITPVAVQPFSIVESVLKMFEAEFISNDIEVSSIHQPSEGEVQYAMLDPSRLTQIFINLLANAMKFTKMAAIRKITVRFGFSATRPPPINSVHWFPTDDAKKDLTANPEWGTGEPVFIYFVVQDTGKGLEQQEMNKVFNRFQQANPRTHVDYGGTGLGLFISRELTELMGGEIGVHSHPGKGSTFAFYVKGRAASAPDALLEASSVSLANRGVRRRSSNNVYSNMFSGTGSAGLSKQQSSCCVLLVEDNVVNARVLTKQIEKAGCQVCIANHGMEALDFLSKSPLWRDCATPETPEPNFVLMDVEMPVMDGLTCTRRIRQLEKEGVILKRIPIIAITANARTEQIAETILAGADDVMPKPFKVAELLAKMEFFRLG